jgi:murein DD-endopeptidase MepM/ murein hydrolase activator NlpD
MNPLAKFASLGKVTKSFGQPTAYEASHQGIDIANKKGTLIPAFLSGKVVKASNGHQPGENNFGNSVTIQDRQGNLHSYNHLLKSSVRPGQVVQQGQNIGSMGDSGSAYSPSGGDATHLDYRIANVFGQSINPSTL